MSVRGVCTSPNGVTGCKSPTCPGSTFNANLGDFRFYQADLHETKKYGSRDEWDSLEMNLTIAVDSMLEDYLALDEKSRAEIRGLLTPEDKELMDEYSEGFDASEIFKATEDFSSNEIELIEKGYLEAALWTGEEELSGGSFTINDLDEQARESVTKDICKFLAENSEYVKAASKVYPLDYIGHDLLLTRNGEGAGFWDRQELKEEGLDAKLTEAARKGFPVRTLVKGDDGKLYFE
jgi:hypothetical protein